MTRTRHRWRVSSLPPFIQRTKTAIRKGQSCSELAHISTAGADTGPGLDQNVCGADDQVLALGKDEEVQAMQSQRGPLYHTDRGGDTNFLNTTRQI
jgi:hypothetical protein